VQNAGDRTRQTDLRDAAHIQPTAGSIYGASKRGPAPISDGPKRSFWSLTPPCSPIRLDCRRVDLPEWPFHLDTLPSRGTLPGEEILLMRPTPESVNLPRFLVIDVSG